MDFGRIFLYVTSTTSLFIQASFAEHVHRLKLIVSRLSSARLQLNRKKCYFAYLEIKVRGPVVSASGISPDCDKVKAVTCCLLPKTLQDFRRFVGLVSYFRRFVRGFATIAAPLTTLVRKDISFTWTLNWTLPFSRLKRVLIFPLVL